MTLFADHIAELTSHRDRELLDFALAGALKDMVQPRVVAINRCVGEVGDRHWLNRARLCRGDAVATSDPPWSDLDTLPKLESGEARCTALTERRVVKSPGPPHWTCFPLFGGGEAVGVVEIETDAALEDSAQRTVEGVLRIYRNFDRLLDYSERDSLTGLLNRKTFDENFLKATADLPPPPDDTDDGRRIRGNASGYWVGVIDIDHFKRVNDAHGHLAGDAVLRDLAALLMASVRAPSDLPVRLGGEEFALILPDTPEDEALSVCERLRERVAAQTFQGDGTPLRISISLGLGEVQDDDVGRILGDVDRALYCAKAAGRNRVCLASCCERGTA